MPRFKKPSAEQVRAMLASVGSLQLRRSFYEDLKNPEWVEPLHTQRAFSSPPEPHIGQDGAVREAYWPEIEYLVNMAPEVPEQVVTVALGLASSTNSWVRRGVIQIAARVPAAQAARLVQTLIQWAPDLGARSDSEDLVKIVVGLIEGGQTRLGRQLATALFRPVKVDGGSGPALAREPRTALEAYWYRKSLPEVVAALGTAGLNQVIGWLERYEEAAGNFDRRTDRDLSAFSRPVIRTSTRHGHEVENALVDALRSLGTEAMTEDPGRTVLAFRRPGMALLTKLLLFVSTQAIRTAEPHQQTKLLAELQPLVREVELAQHDYRPEFPEFLEAVANASGQDVLMGLVPTLEAGPLGSRAALEERMRADTDDAEQAELRTKEYLEQWQHRFLASIGAEALPPELRARLQTLDADLGEIEEPRRSDFEITTWVGPTSPLDADAITSLAPEELISHLQNWHPGPDIWAAPSHEGQGRTLRGVIAEHPLAVSVPIERLRTLRPLYLRAILEGWADALKKGLRPPWDLAEELTAFVLEHDDASPLPKEGRDFDDDGDFVGAKRAAIDLLQVVGSQEPTKVNDEHAGFVIQLAPLVVKASREPSTREQYLTTTTESFDPLTLSLNERLPELARLLAILTQWGEFGAADSEVLAALQELAALDDPRGSLPAVMGEAVARLHNHALPWLEAHKSGIFGDLSTQTRSHQIALSTALATHTPHLLLLNLLRDPIRAALASPEEIAAGWAGADRPVRLIGDWLVNCMVTGEIDQTDELLKLYLDVTSPEVRGEVLGHIGFALLHTDNPDPSILQRAEAFWDSRRAHVAQEPADATELQDFYWWIASEKFATEWWLPRLQDLVNLIPDVPTHGMIGEHLAAAAASDPYRTFDVIQRLIDGHATDGAYRGYDLVEDAIPQTLASAFDEGGADLVARAARLMDQLGEQGYIRLEERVNALRKKP
jgi:hypothetical protein